MLFTLILEQSKYNLDLVTQTTQIKTSLAGHSTALEAVITPGIAQGSGKKTEFEFEWWNSARAEGNKLRTGLRGGTLATLPGDATVMALAVATL